MQLTSKEHHELMASFEQQCKTKPARESKDLWSIGAIYCDGPTNRDFLRFREGYSLAKAIYQTAA